MSGPSPETGKPLETPKEKADALKKGVETKMGKDAINKVNAMSKDPTAFFRVQANRSWDQLKTFQGTFAKLDQKLFDGTDKRNPLDTAAGSKPVQDIMRKLEACAAVGIPDYKNNEIVKNITGTAAKYLRTEVMSDQRKAEPELYSRVRVDVEEVAKDIKQLEEVKGLYPGNKGIDAMIQSLRVLASVDPAEVASYVYAEQRSNRPANQAMMMAGKLGAVTILTGMTALTGVMALVTKKMSVAPFLYGGLLLYVVNPSMFTGKDQPALKQAASVAAQPAFFDNLAPRYGMEGQEWADVIATLLRMQTKTTSELQKYLTNPNAENTKNLAEALAPGDRNPARAGVERLIKNEADFKGLRDMLADVTDKRAQDLLLGYVTSGSWKLARQAGVKKPMA